VKELLYVKTLLQELIGNSVTANMNMDNQSAIKLCKNGIFNKRSKHIDVRYHFLTENVRQGNIKRFFVPSAENIADIFTKPLPSVRFQELRKYLVC